MSKQTNDFIIQKITGNFGNPNEYWDGKYFTEVIANADIYKDRETALDELMKIKDASLVRQLTDFEMGIFYDDL